MAAILQRCRRNTTIMVGGGHTGLAAAASPGGAGFSTLVLERRPGWKRRLRPARPA